MMDKIRTAFMRFLEIIVGINLIALLIVVVLGVVYRKTGHSLVWYDEVASVLLAWLTYYGSALAALKRAHIGFSGLVEQFSAPWRIFVLLITEVIVISFFVVLAWMGFVVLDVLEGDTLVSLPQVSVQITQSVIPIGACLFILAQLLSLPDMWRRVKAGDALSEAHA